MNEYIITFVETLSVTDCRDILAKEDISIVKDYADASYFCVKADRAVIEEIAEVLHIEEADKPVVVQLLVDNTEHQNYTSVTPSAKFWPLTLASGTDVVIVDSGIMADHTEFSNTIIKNLYSKFNDFADNIGHGTAMASLVAGGLLGLAKDTNLHIVKLFDLNDSLTIRDIVNALDAVTEQFMQAPTHPVVLMAWSIERNDIVDYQIKRMNNNNIIVVCAAGNDGVDVDTKSPAGVNDVITVGSFDRDYRVRPFANAPLGIDSTEERFVNFGAELDIFALGVDVTVASLDGAYQQAAGTSVSAAIVAGVAAQYARTYSHATAAEIKTMLLERGTEYGTEMLVFDEADPLVDYSAVVKSIALSLIQPPEERVFNVVSGRICTVEKGTGKHTVDLGLNKDATDVQVIDFATCPPWITVDLATGIVTIDTDYSNLPAEGAYLFALRGNLNEKIIVEEYGVSLQDNKESNIGTFEHYYYDQDIDKYDIVVNYELALSAKD